eukprot:TRINITY_DN25684_c0_g1_i3.p1 TRINITY_DN25684_c0_g1~~TRINITY_DN25684_c0_g1_i3.p1  ORF type:complete len:351 (+),score=40.93 TRINITY_DN25684_c0_g1_i3:127-1179(+)
MQRGLVGSEMCIRDRRRVHGDVFLKLNPCNESKVCDIQGGEGTILCTDTYQSPFRYPGEVCKSDLECYSGSCKTEGLCEGGAREMPCTSDADCDVQLYCDMTENKCKLVSSLGQDCSVSKCDSAFVCNKGRCVDYGSIGEGQPASVPAACATFFISGEKCAKGPPLIRPIKTGTSGPVNCTTQCSYKLKSEIIKEPCQCGRNSNGQKYCHPGVGDIQITDFFDYTKKLGNFQVSCHISKGPLCLYKNIEEMSTDYFKALVVYNNLTRWNLLYKVPECVTKIMDIDYFYALDRLEGKNKPFEKKGGPIVFSIVVSVILIVLLILICVRYDGGPKKHQEPVEELKINDSIRE